jgi:hypothetical protein
MLVMSPVLTIGNGLRWQWVKKQGGKVVRWYTGQAATGRKCWEDSPVFANKEVALMAV